MTSHCSPCIQDTTGYPCGWCESPNYQCSVSEECSGPTHSFVTMGTQCPDPIIKSISPTSGPLSGGTVITIIGTDLGVTLDDFDSENGIKIGGVACTPLMRDYISGKQVLCMTQNAKEVGRKMLTVNLTRHNGIVVVTANMAFYVASPTVISVEPAFGPIAGGSVLTIRGMDLNIGNSARVTLYGYFGRQCNVTYVRLSLLHVLKH